jgi:endonuclease/exonuclease/phosphatase family metal-dependent hydrolase
MTFNIRFENDRDGANNWDLRRDMAVEVVQGHGPSILGTQEGKWSQLVYLRDRLPEYALNAPGRVVDMDAQYPSLFFRKADLDVREGGEFWLSETPAAHRSKDWGSAFPRMLNYAQVCLKRGGKTCFWVGVTHLDHVGAEARYRQAEMLSDWIRSRKGPVILMGDFNDDPGSSVHRVLTSSQTDLQDTWQVLGRGEDESAYTHHGFQGIPKKSRIDWILVSSHFQVKGARIIRHHLGNRYPSDHFPYEAELGL